MESESPTAGVNSSTAAAAGVEDEQPPPPITYRIGYVLTPKKVESFIRPSLLNLAAQRGIHLFPLDPNKPLSDQLPFDCLLHKLYGPDWTQQLRHFSSLYPHVPIIDPPEAIARLHDRLSMLQVVQDLHLHLEQQEEEDSCSFGIPHQVLVPDTQHLHQELPPISLLKFPVIAKPLVADGTAGSHQMSLVFNQRGLEELDAAAGGPIVLQEFVNHGGVVFKVYVVGEYVECVKRMSLPDIVRMDEEEEEEDDNKGGAASGASRSYQKKKNDPNLLKFSQISNLAAGGDADSMVEVPVSFLNGLAKGLRNALGLHLFNFDVIRDMSGGGTGNNNDDRRYLVIDINYFPGYAKMPSCSYETVFTDFFLHLLSSE